MSGSRIVIEQFHSPALEGNPLGDPTTRPVPVYLPPGFDPKHSYPSLYMLAAFGSRGLRFLNDELWEENIQQRLDRLIAAGSLQPVILVMPDASTRLGGSQYINSAGTGRYEDHILELVDFIDAKYPTRPTAASRAVLGHSSGGFAALRFGMLHPDIFGLVADHSGDKAFEWAYRPDFGDLLRYFERVGEAGLLDLLKHPGEGLRRGAPHGVLNLLAMATIYSPNPRSPLGCDLPVDLHSGVWLPDVWQRWLAFDPLQMLPAHIDALRSLRLLYIDCGRYDEYNLLYSARQFVERLRAHNVPFTYEEYDGGHRNMKHRYDTSLSAISTALA